MAEDVASRVAGAEALPPELLERVERAAARLGSIHERWSTPPQAAPTLGSPAEKAGIALADGVPGSEDDALPLAREVVSVTPILGIETDESDEAGRPRFKTLMGVPRSSPELDELAGLDSSSERQHTVPVERSASRPALAATSSERATPRVDEAPSLAATSLPWEPAAAPAPGTRVSHARWPSLAESSLDVSAASAASASASRPRRWWIGLGAIVAAAASFALVAPRQRTLALRWLESEYHARLRPTADAISNSAPALRPGASAAASTPPAIGGATAQLEAQVTPPAGTMGESAVELPGTRDQAATGAFSAGTSAEDASFGAAGANVPNEDVARDTPASGNGSARKSKLVTRNARSAGTASKARAQVAAVRKPALRADRDQTTSSTTTSSTTTSSTRVAARSATKARATRQNTPRKDGRSGIIRETPF